MLAGWAAVALLPAGPAPAPARCLNRIPVREVRSLPGRCVADLGEGPNPRSRLLRSLRFSSIDDRADPVVALAVTTTPRTDP